MIEWAPVIMPEFIGRARLRRAEEGIRRCIRKTARETLALPKSPSCDERRLEFGRGLVRFHDADAKGDPCFARLGQSGLKRSPFVALRSPANGANRCTHRPEESNRALRDDDVNAFVPQVNPHQPIAGEGSNGVDASSEAGAEMI